MDILFATSNIGKLKEAKEILGSYNILSLSDFDKKIEVVEDGETFEENAVKKATEISRILNIPVLADDSGLEVDFLDKAPGVLSARFMGEDTSYDIKNQYIIDKLDGIEDERRTARFVCAIAYAAPDGRVFTARGTIEGIIGRSIVGGNGFGYDPIFFVPSLGKTTAELSMEEKNRISHRGNALRAICEALRGEGII
ncbi:non-canonical purine NTP pyrophosphatase [Clostridia bacterium]|nr:non-canonical purine NTP pyrophosphatase [Clostridia bacterium]